MSEPAHFSCSTRVGISVSVTYKLTSQLSFQLRLELIESSIRQQQKMETPPVAESTVLENPGGKLLCLTILGYRKPGMTEEEYRHHMTKISAPMTQDLMVKYGMVRWTQVGHRQY